MISGVRYLFVLFLMFLGFWFIGQNLMRRMQQQNRAKAVQNHDYDTEAQISKDLGFITQETFSSLLRNCLSRFWC